VFTDNKQLHDCAKKKWTFITSEPHLQKYEFVVCCSTQGTSLLHLETELHKSLKYTRTKHLSEFIHNHLMDFQITKENRNNTEADMTTLYFNEIWQSAMSDKVTIVKLLPSYFNFRHDTFGNLKFV
jgi:hypothetical protein